MKIFPAIDIRDGKVVRLTHGDFNKEVRYELTPMEAAVQFAEAGAKNLHIVDLDGAKDDSLSNFDIIKSIVQETGMFVEVGGGIRNQERLERYLDIGVNRVILGTIAVNNIPFLRDMATKYSDRLAVGIDVKDGYVATKGWQELSGMVGEDFCSRLHLLGVLHVIYTDISRDGTLGGVNVELYERLVKKCALDIIASGGVGSLDDIRKLRDVGVHGVVLGKALYSGAIDLKRALEVAGEDEQC